ncbi:GIY-YIG nuclease family protein [Enterococcus hirae]|nr:GIY-YIG nuclease family protein [Enterococcus hirae]
MHYFYVLLCCDETLYAGYSTDVAKRFQAHRTGKGAKYTRAHPPKCILYTEAFTEKRAALQQEYAFKQLSRAKKLEFLQAHGVQLPDDA